MSQPPLQILVHSATDFAFHRVVGDQRESGHTEFRITLYHPSDTSETEAWAMFAQIVSADGYEDYREHVDGRDEVVVLVPTESLLKGLVPPQRKVISLPVRGTIFMSTNRETGRVL